MLSANNIDRRHHRYGVVMRKGSRDQSLDIKGRKGLGLALHRRAIDATRLNNLAGARFRLGRKVGCGNG